MPTEIYGSGTTPTLGDTERVIEVKILTALSTGGGGGALSGHGPPVSTPTSSAAIYFDVDDGTQYDWYSGSWH